MNETTGEIRERQGWTVRASRTVAAFLAKRGKGLAVMAAAGLFLAVAGPFGTGDLPLWVRLAYWPPLMIGISLIVGPLVELLPKPFLESGPRWQVWAAITAATSIPTLPFVWLITSYAFFGGPSLASLLWLTIPVVSLSATMSAVMLLVERPGPQTHAPPARTGETAPPPPPRFLSRLPAKLMGAQLYAIEAEDHYLRLHTSKGQDLILFRLADAIGELDGVEGAQVHRSWWVARDGVTQARRANGRVSLALRNGAEAPVSRPNVKPLKDAGWL